LPAPNRRKRKPEKTTQPPPTPPWIIAARAAEDKKALDLRILDLQGLASFTDYFVICSGSNPRQIQAIADEIERRLAEQGRKPLGIEGYEHAEWVLVDYGEFLVHIFSEAARAYYDLERLWRKAKEVTLPPAE
jgi:ribosome-associated protein